MIMDNLHGRLAVTPRKFTILCELRGCLVLIEAAERTDGQPGKCPSCGYTQFRDGTGWDKGWTKCDNPEGCDFAALTSHLKR